MKVDRQLYIDARKYGNLARFINLSCTPNCVATKSEVDGNPRLGVVVKEYPISKGEEVTLDQTCTAGLEKVTSGPVKSKVRQRFFLDNTESRGAATAGRASCPMTRARGIRETGCDASKTQQRLQPAESGALFF